ncbi:MAG: 54S ribosomal protein L3, partial [Paramarteilia canceri]
ILDNHVVDYWEPEKCDKIFYHGKLNSGQYGVNLVGSFSMLNSKIDEWKANAFLTRGLVPKKVVKKFFVEPRYSLPAGYQITAKHFKPGEYIDAMAKTY